MCYFVTIGVGAATEVILTRSSGLTIRPAVNPCLTRLFPPGDRLYWVTHGWCACDIVYGERRHGEDPEADRAKFRARGWSEAKVARAVAAKHRERPHVPRDQREATPRDSLMDLLAALSVCPGGVRIFAHMYKGAQDEERVTGQTGGAMCIDDLKEATDFPVDAVVAITPSPDSPRG
ncbi:MAG TPA: hypothetical protein VKS60_19070 [Stellaceae bacterium]|nr:hypothetical protein [Stellaceae bacterium]